MEGTTSLWWDMESCPVPSYIDPYIVASMAPSLLRDFNIVTSMVNGGGGCSSLDQHHFSAYEFFSETETELHQMLINSGIELHPLPPGKTSNEMEKMMMADVLLWAMDTPPPANIIFIVGNVDFCYLFQKLRQRSYNVFLVCQSMSEMPQGMLGGVNNCLGWLSFLRSLQIEDQHSHFPGGIRVYDHTFSNTAFPASSTPIYNREMEGSSNASSFNYSQENLSLKPSLGDEWGSTCNFPSTLSDGCGSTSNFPSTLSDGWDSPCNFPLDETASSQVQPELRFHGHSIRTKTPRSPASSESSTEKKKPASLEEFKAWLTLVVNGKKHAEEGYNISPVRLDFEKATGKILDEKLLGFLKIINLVEYCKDVAVIKEVKRGCHLAFPVKPNEQANSMPSLGGRNSNPNKKSFPVKPHEQENPMPSLGGRNSNPNKKSIPVKPHEQKNPMPSLGGRNSNPNKKFEFKDKPRSETKPRPKRKASAEDFRKFIYHMRQVGELSQGFLMARLPQRFEQHTGKFLDVEHLGYKKMSELVASCSDLVSVHSVGPGPVRLFPAGFVNEPVPHLYPNSNTIKVTSINMDSDPTNLKAKVVANRPSSGGSGKDLIENSGWEDNISYEHPPYMNYESQWLPMTFGGIESASFNPREANTPAFQEYSIKSDSSSPPGGSQVSEWEGQSSNAIGETMSFHGGYEGSDFIKQHATPLQWESNDPIGDSVNAERLMAEAMQNMRLMKESTIFCEQPCIPAGTVFPDSILPSSDSPSSEPQAGGCNNPLDPLQCTAESSAVCADSPLQWESNDPIGDSVDAERLMAEAMQNMSLMKESTILCEEPCSPAGTVFPDSILPSSDSPSSEPQADGRNSPLDPLQCRAESSAVCAEDLTHGIKLDCEQKEQNLSSTGNEEKITSAVSSAGSIIEVAGRGLKSFYELKIWRKN